MLRQHRGILSKNCDFLVGEIPMDGTLEALKSKNVLTKNDFDQLRTLKHQGRRALARYLLGVLPFRGSDAYDAFLQSLQEANAQHIVDLMIEQANAEVHTPLLHDNQGNPLTPSDTPLPTQLPDPHDYVVRLTKNAKLIRGFVQPIHVAPVLVQNKVMAAREADMLEHLHGKRKKWDLLMAILLQRGERAYQAFMAALLQNGYSTIFHTIRETSTNLSQSEEDADLLDPVKSPENSDDEIQAELDQTSRKITTPQKDRSDDALLSRSRDLQDVNQGDDRSLTETDDRLSKDTDLDGYMNFG